MAATAAMTTILATQLKHDHVFEMFGNLYQIDAISGIGDVVGIHAHLIAQVGDSGRIPGKVAIHLNKQTPVQIEA